MDYKQESEVTLPEGKAERKVMVDQFFGSTAYRYAQQQFTRRLNEAWLQSVPGQADKREELYYLAKAFQGLTQELRKVLSDAEFEIGRESSRG